MESLNWRVGELTIRTIFEAPGDFIQEYTPGATPENVKQIPWLGPNFADNEGKLKYFLQTFVIETPTKTILVDTGVGNHKKRKDVPDWNNLNTDFIAQLARLGHKPEDIDVVLASHLHFDHVGWNTTHADGKWVPTFPKARHLIVKKEFEYWQSKPKQEIADDHAGFVDSILPLHEAKLIDFVRDDHNLDEISFVPTPGHTPNHVSFLLESKGESAFISGDLLHHPCQIAHPEWSSEADTDMKQASITRRTIIEHFADSDTLFIGNHFPTPVAGHIKKDGDSFKFE